MRTFFFLIIILFGTQLLGQSIHFETLSVEDGLPRSGVYNLMEDQNGFIWIGTEGGGVCFFDGKSFHTLTTEDGLIDNNVRRVFQDSDGGYWFGTPRGASYFHHGKFLNFTKDDGLEDDFVRFIEEDADRNVWISTNDGVSIFNLNTLKIEKSPKFNFSLPTRRVRCLLFDGASMWIGTDAGLCKFKDGKLKIITTLNGLAHNRILCLYKDGNKEEVYVGTDAGLSILKNDVIIKNITKEDGLINDRIRAIVSSPINNFLYLGTRKGFSGYNLENGNVINLQEENGLSNNRIRSLIKDSHQNIWIGTYFGGVMMYGQGDFFGFSKKNGLLSNQIFHILEDANGDIVVSTNEGVSKMRFHHSRLKSIQNIQEDDGLIFPEVHSTYRDSNSNYWFGTSNGISIFHKNQHVRNISVEDGLVDAKVNIIKELFPDEFWVGTEDGISVIRLVDGNLNQMKFENYAKGNGLSGYDVSFIEKDSSGNVWVGFKDGNINIVRDHQIIKPRQDQVLRKINTGIIDRNNVVWLGTEGEGLVRVEYDSEKKELLSNRVTTKNGILSNFIYSIAQSKKGNLWLGTEKGASKIVFKKDQEIQYVRSYGVEDGFIGLENNPNSILCDEKGNLWFGTLKGIMFLSHLNESGVELEAKIYIRSIEGSGYHYDWIESAGDSGVFVVPQDIAIPYRDNFLEIEFLGLFSSSPEKLEYSWRFSGTQKWSPFSKRDYIHLANLDPGTYNIQIRSKTPENIILSQPVEIKFTVLEPFYMNFWFRFFIAVLLIGIAYLIYLWRVRKFKRRQIALEEIVVKRTEEISTQNEELSLKNKEITDSINYAKRIQDTIIPSDEKIASILGRESFVLFKPKDIVSGDFYWIREIDKNTSIFCVADCTGHGVPGAMVSLVGVNALNKAVGEFGILQPSEILNKVNSLLNEAFSSEGKSVSDGMDIAICKITKSDEGTSLEYSGGNNPLWVFNPKRSSFPENAKVFQDEERRAFGFALSPNKFGLGKHFKEESFTNHKLSLLKGDELVIFTDGYADQFGGKTTDSKPMGKKFKYARMRSVLAEFHHEHLAFQKEILDKTIEDWRGDLEQVDDICLLALKIE